LFAGPVTNTVNVIDLIRSGQVDYHIAPQCDGHDPASEVFNLKDGVLIISGRVQWIKCDEEWKDIRSFHGKEDRDAPTGEWNRLEVIAKGDTLRYLLNGWVVNEATGVSPCEGRVCLQTEAA